MRGTGTRRLKSWEGFDENHEVVNYRLSQLQRRTPHWKERRQHLTVSPRGRGSLRNRTGRDGKADGTGELSKGEQLGIRLLFSFNVWPRAADDVDCLKPGDSGVI